MQGLYEREIRRAEWESAAFLRHFTHFNRRGQLMGLFLSGAGINQEVSGSHRIWAVVLFTNDWLASQNHQIHLLTVSFITVIFKVTATCLVSQHWPPHIYSHLLSASLFPLLHLSSSLILIHSVAQYLVSHSHVVSSTPPLLLSFLLLFNYFCLIFSLFHCFTPIPHHPLLVLHIFSLSLLCRFRGSRVREVWRETREREEKIRPPLLPLSEGCVLNLYIVRSP